MHKVIWGHLCGPRFPAMGQSKHGHCQPGTSSTKVNASMTVLTSQLQSPSPRTPSQLGGFDTSHHFQNS